MTAAAVYVWKANRWHREAERSSEEPAVAHARELAMKPEYQPGPLLVQRSDAPDPSLPPSEFPPGATVFILRGDTYHADLDPVLDTSRPFSSSVPMPDERYAEYGMTLLNQEALTTGDGIAALWIMLDLMVKAPSREIFWTSWKALTRNAAIDLQNRARRHLLTMQLRTSWSPAQVGAGRALYTFGSRCGMPRLFLVAAGYVATMPEEWLSRRRDRQMRDECRNFGLVYAREESGLALAEGESIESIIERLVVLQTTTLTTAPAPEA